MNRKRSVGLNYLLDKLVLQGKRKTDRMIYLNALLFQASIIVNMTAGRVEKHDGTKVNFFGLTLANSSAGKDFSFKLANEVLGVNPKVYANYSKNNLEKNLSMDPNMDQDYYEKVVRFSPQHYLTDASGTKQGLFSLANTISLSHFGSLNITSSEIGDNITDSLELLNMLKQLYDGSVLGRVIQSERIPNIENITTNILLFGSQVGFNLKAKQELLKLLQSGLYRRSLIINIESKAIEIQDEEAVEIQKEALEEAISYGKQLIANYLNETKQCEIDYLFEATEAYMKAVVDINKQLIENANKNLENKYIGYDSSAIQIIENIATLIAFLDQTKTVDDIHIYEAFEIFKYSRNTILSIIEPPMTHISVYELLKISHKKMSLHEIATFIEIPSTLKLRDEMIELFEEYSYHKGYIPKITGRKVKYLELNKPEENELDKIIVSIDCHNYESQNIEPQMNISYAQTELPFFGENKSIEGLIKSNTIKSFTCSWFSSSDKSNKHSLIDGAGHRNAENFIQGQNLIAFDIDDGMTIEEAQELLKYYTYIMYTTRSHRKEKNGEIQGDRFRILIPTKTKFYVDPEKHKQLYENIAKFLGLTIYDKATRNVSRLWYTNSDAEIFKNESDLLDVSTLIPETEKRELMLPLINGLMETDPDLLDEYERRMLGIKKWFLANTGTGNRNENLYKVSLFVKDLGGDVEYEITSLNNMLLDPLSEKELNQILRRNG